MVSRKRVACGLAPRAPCNKQTGSNDDDVSTIHMHKSYTYTKLLHNNNNNNNNNNNTIIFQSLNDVNVADVILSRVVVMDVWWCCDEKAYLEQLSEHLIAH
jgi:hypothetical protein